MDERLTIDHSRTKADTLHEPTSDLAATIPHRIRDRWSESDHGKAWLESLPALIRDLERRWDLTLEDPYDNEDVSVAWVAPAQRADGSKAVLKIGMPHMEADHETEALGFWAGDAAVLLLEADPDLNAMLLERCEPGFALRTLPEADQDVVIAGLLRRLWRVPPDPHPFRPLSEMTRAWAEESRQSSRRWADPGLVAEGLRLFEELPHSAPEQVLLATDLHAGNVLSAAREPWLVIDPKPFVGDPAYDATQHLFNCLGRLKDDPHALIRRFAELLDVDEERVRLWTFARAAAETGWDRHRDELLRVARALSP